MIIHGYIMKKKSVMGGLLFQYRKLNKGLQLLQKLQEISRERIQIIVSEVVHSLLYCHIVSEVVHSLLYCHIVSELVHSLLYCHS